MRIVSGIAAALLLAGLASLPAGAQTVEPPAEEANGEAPTMVVINGSRSPELQPYRYMLSGLDAFDDEPLPADSPWRALDNVTMTTHFGGDTASTNRTSAALVATAVLEYARTGQVKHAVNAAQLGWV